MGLFGSIFKGITKVIGGTVGKVLGIGTSLVGGVLGGIFGGKLGGEKFDLGKDDLGGQDKGIKMNLTKEDMARITDINQFLQYDVKNPLDMKPATLPENLFQNSSIFNQTNNNLTRTSLSSLSPIIPRNFGNITTLGI